MPKVNSTIKTKISTGKPIPVKVSGNSALSVNISSNTNTGTYDYDKLINHPYMNGREVEGKKDAKYYNLQELLEPITEQDIDDIMFGGD